MDSHSNSGVWIDYFLLEHYCWTKPTDSHRLLQSHTGLSIISRQLVSDSNSFFTALYIEYIFLFKFSSFSSFLCIGCLEGGAIQFLIDLFIYWLSNARGAQHNVPAVYIAIKSRCKLFAKICAENRENRSPPVTTSLLVRAVSTLVSTALRIFCKCAELMARGKKSLQSQSIFS